MTESHRPHWLLPAGVTRGLWDYAHAEHIAGEYDLDLADHPLFALDEAILAKCFEPGRIVADLGCGTGRALVPLARRGLRGLAVDLSEPMLRIVRAKAAAEALDIQCVRANLVELDALADAAVDYAICLFSTLGMIRGRANRQQVLQHAHRILRPGGLFVLHVHNFWNNLYDPGGPWWVLTSLWQSWFDAEFDLGDKFFPYRGIPNMYLHVFTPGELTTALAAAGFTLREFLPLDGTLSRPLAWPWVLGSLRASGWIVVCER